MPATLQERVAYPGDQSVRPRHMVAGDAYITTASILKELSALDIVPKDLVVRAVAISFVLNGDPVLRIEQIRCAHKVTAFVMNREAHHGLG